MKGRVNMPIIPDTIENIDDYVEHIDKDSFFNSNSFPQNVYHYTSGIALKSIIENNQLWVTNSDYLNDRTEINYTLNLVFEVIDNCVDTDDKDKELFKETVRFWYSKFLKSVDKYILSLSTNKDNILLWSNYSNNDGYNIGIHANCLYQQLNTYFRFVENAIVIPHEVIYDLEIQRQMITKEIKVMYSIFIYCNKNNIMDKFMHYRNKNSFNLTLYALFFKDELFNKEEEYRVAILDFDNKLKSECKFSNGVFIPYIPIPIHYTNEYIKGMIDFFGENGSTVPDMFDVFNRSPISSITIGPKNNLDIAESGLKSFLSINKINADNNFIKKI